MAARATRFVKLLCQALRTDANSIADVPLTVKAVAGQTAKQIDVLTSADVSKFSVSEAGNVIAAGTLAVTGAAATGALTVTGAATVSTTLGVTGTLSLTKGLLVGATARTATSAGLTTGTILTGETFISVTSAGANDIMILPAPTPGTIVILAVAATGYELRSSSPTTIGINGGTGADAESAIPANTTAILICESATTWKGLQMAIGGTLTLVEVAA